MMCEDADKHNWTKEELEAYDYALMREQDDRGRLSFATKKVQTNIAKSLLDSGLSVEETAKHTELTIDQVQKLSGK